MSASPNDPPPPRINIDLTQMLAEMPSRLTRVETLLETMREQIGKLEAGQEKLRADLRTDFRWLLGLLIPCLGALLAKAFHWIS